MTKTMLLAVLVFVPACGANSHDDDTGGEGEGEPGCNDLDGDGYGVGHACRGADCDEGNPARHEGCAADCVATPEDVGCPCTGQPIACFDADFDLAGTGACASGLRYCEGGVWSFCADQTLPSVEACDLIDNDCDGQVDEGMRDCELNDTRCNGAIVEDCTEGADGCPGWLASDDCSGRWMWCAEGAEGAACTCDACPAADETQCNGDVIETCTEDADGCLGWVATEDCLSSELVCRRRRAGSLLRAVCMDCDSGVSQGDYRVTDDASIAALRGYTGVTGDLVINRTGLDSFRSLLGLECLQSVEGTLLIEGHTFVSSAPGPTTLEGLNNLTSIGGDLRVRGNPELTTIGGLSGLTSVGGSIHAVENRTLRNLDGLGGITTVEGELRINSNDALTTLDGLHGLASVGGDLGIGCFPTSDEAWTCPGNASLTNLDGLAGLTSVGDDMGIGGNVALPTCEAEALRDRLIEEGWAGDCTIEGNDADGVCEQSWGR